MYSMEVDVAMAYCHQCGAAVTPTNLCPKCGAARRQPHDDAAGSADSTAPEPQAPATPEVVDPTIASPRFGSRTGPDATPVATPAVSSPRVGLEVRRIDGPPERVGCDS